MQPPMTELLLCVRWIFYPRAHGSQDSVTCLTAFELRFDRSTMLLEIPSVRSRVRTKAVDIGMLRSVLYLHGEC
jgi:hypothetical protein